MKLSSFTGVGRKPANITRDPFGEHLLNLRLHAGLSQDQLADAIGVSQQTVAHWERIGDLANKDVIPTMAKTLGVSLEELFMLKPNGARHRGPKGDLEKLLSELETLPKSRRRQAVEFLRAWIKAHPG